MDENNSLRTTAKEFSNTSVSEMEARITSDIDKATSDFKKAYEEGDADKIMEAQTKMIDVATQRSKLDQVKQYSDPANFDQSKVPDIVPPPNSRAVEWASENPWFNKDKSSNYLFIPVAVGDVDNPYEGDEKAIKDGRKIFEAASRLPSRNTAPANASKASASIEGFFLPPERSSPLPNSK